MGGNENIIGTYQIKIEVHSHIYIVEWTRTSEEIDSLNTGSELNIINESGTSHLNARIYPYDKFNHQLTIEILEKIKTKSTKDLQVYAKGPNGEIIDFEFVKIEILKADGEDFPNYYYKSKENITIYGEYNLYVFLDEKIITCQTCYSNFQPSEKIIRKAKTTEIYLIDYKTFTKIPMG